MSNLRSNACQQPSRVGKHVPTIVAQASLTVFFLLLTKAQQYQTQKKTTNSGALKIFTVHRFQSVIVRQSTAAAVCHYSK